MHRPLISLCPQLRDAISHSRVVTSNARLSQEIKYAHGYEQSRNEASAWITPAVSHWHRWITEQFQDLQAIGYAPSCKKLIGGELARRAIQLTAPRADVEQHARQFENAWTLAYEWNLWPVWQDVNETADGRLCNRWSQAFRAFLDEQDLITAPEISSVLLTALHDGTWKPTPITTFGIEAPNRSQSSLLSAIMQAGGEVKTITSEFRSNAEPMRIGFPDAMRERMSMALCSQQVLQELGAGTRVGILITNLTGEQTTLRRQFEAVFPDLAEVDQIVNIGSSHELRQCAMADEIMQFLRWTVTPVRYTELGAIARSKYLTGLALPTQPSVLNRERVAFRPFANQSGKDWLKETAAGVHPRRRLILSGWVGFARGLLASVGWQIPKPSNKELAQRMAIINAINDVGRSNSLTGSIPWSDAVRQFCEAIGVGSYRTAASNAPIQVMTHQDSRYLNFDALWVTGMSDAEWPRAPSPNPMIPIGLLRRAQVAETTHTDLLKTARELTEQWKQRTEKLVYSYVQPDQDSRAQPSSLIAEYSETTVQDLLGDVAHFSTHDHVWVASASTPELERYASEYGTSVESPTDRSFPISLLESQSQCSFQAWASFRLGLRQEQSPNLFPSAADRGSAVHKALEELVKRHPSRDEIAKIKHEEITDVVSKVLKPMRNRLPASYVSNELRRIDLLLQNWVRYEAERAPFEVESVEASVKGELGGVRFSTRVDRIDKCQSGGRLIIDYKTGEAKPKSWEGERPKAPQLPLYLLMDDQSNGIAFYKISNDELRLLGTGDDTVDIPPRKSALDNTDFATRREGWSVVLSDLATQFLSGEARVDPVHEACNWCHLQGFCRVFEFQPGE